MKKNIIIALCVLLLLVAVFAVVLFVPFGGGNETDKNVSNISVFTAEKANIVGIDVKVGTDYYELVKQNETWLFNGEEGVHAIQPKVDGIAYDLSNLYAERVIEENAQDFGMYGLDPAVSTVVVHLADGTARTFFVGNRVQNQNQYYFATDQDRTVYAVGNGKGLVMTYKKEDLISTSLQEIYKGDIDEITILRNDGYTLKIKQNLTSETESWILTEPYIWATDETKIQSKLLNFVVGLSALDYVEDKSDAEMGLENPRVSVTVLKTDGTEHHFYVGNTVENAAYVRVDGVKNAALVDAEINKLAQINAFEIMSKNLQMADYYGLKNLKLSGDAEFQLEYGQKSSKLNGKEIDQDTAIRLYSAVCTLTVDAEAPNARKGEKVLEAVFDYAAGYDYRYTIYEYDNRNYTVTHDGKKFFLIRKDTYNAWKTMLGRYL